MLDGLDFVTRDLRVRYRGAAVPQRLDISVTTGGAVPVEFGRVFVRRVADTINFGAAGGSAFSPAAGRATLIGGPPDGQALGPQYDWTLEVTAVSPRALRTMVEHLRLSAGGYFPTVAMSIMGTLPPDGGPLSATEDDVRSYLRDPNGYIDAWPQPGFPVSSRKVSSGAVVVVTMADEISKDVADALESTLIAWINVTSEYLSDRGDHIRVSNGWERIPTFARGKAELRGRYQAFPRSPGPSRDVLINMLARIHDAVAPIAHVEIGL